jgi:hypothetical protein
MLAGKLLVQLNYQRRIMKSKFLSQRSLTVLLTTILLLVAIPVASVFAVTSGPNYPGTATNGGGGGSAWTASAAGTIVAALGADGGTTVSASTDTQDLNMTNFGFAIPTNATITGISVEMNRWASGSGVRDNQVQLLGGSAAGTDQAITGTDWSTNNTTVVPYGGSTDLWGLTWTPAQINNSSFGVVLDVTDTGPSRTATVDYVRITVSYIELSVTNSPVTYDGTQQAATVTGGADAGTVTDVRYNGSPTVPTDAGTYAITADFDPTVPGIPNINDAPAGNFVIAKADAVIDITPYSVTYDGSAHTATGTAKGVNDEALGGLDLSSTTHTNAGTYNSDPWTFTAPNGNYNNDSGTVNNSIAKANAVIVVTPYSVTYDGSAHTATGTATGVNDEAPLEFNQHHTHECGTYNNDPGPHRPNGNCRNDSGTSTASQRNAVIVVTPPASPMMDLSHRHWHSHGCQRCLSGLDLSGTAHTVPAPRQ